MNEQEINEALGLEPEEETPPEAIDAPEDGNTGTAEPEPEETGEAAEPTEEPEPEPEPEETPPAAQEPKQPTREELLAEARRQLEAENARTMDEAIRGLGIVDPYTKKPVTTLAEYRDYKAKVDADKRERFMKKAGMTPEAFAEFIASQPEMQQAHEAARRAALERQQAVINEQMRQLHELDPNINTPQDLPKMQNFAEFTRLVKQHNLDFVSAYKLANMDALTERRVEASRQAARNAAAAKAHLQPSKPRSAGDGAADVTIPAETLELYRDLFPDASTAELKRDYAQYLAANKKKGVR